MVKNAIPHKLPPSRRRCHPPWLTPAIQCLLKQKSKAWRLRKANPGDPAFHARFSHLWEQCKNEFQIARRQSVQQSFENCENIQEFWRAYRLLSGKSRRAVSINFAADSQGEESQDPAERLAAFFESVHNPVSVPGPHLVADRPPLDFLLTPQLVEHSLSRLRPLKSIGGDGIPAVLLRNVTAVVAPSLAHIYTQPLLQRGVVQSKASQQLLTIQKHRSSHCLPMKELWTGRWMDRQTKRLLRSST